MDLDLIGKWSFIAGLVIAVLAAFVTKVDAPTIALVLFVLGLIVGYVNVDKEKTTEFLVAVIALLAAGSLGAIAVGQLTTTVGYLETILTNFAAFSTAAALVVSVRAIVELAKK